ICEVIVPTLDAPQDPERLIAAVAWMEHTEPMVEFVQLPLHAGGQIRSARFGGFIGRPHQIEAFEEFRAALGDGGHYFHRSGSMPAAPMSNRPTKVRQAPVINPTRKAKPPSSIGSDRRPVGEIGTWNQGRLNTGSRNLPGRHAIGRNDVAGLHAG